MIVEEFDDKQQIHQYISHLLDNEKEQLLKTGYFDKQLQNNTASFIHKNYVKYNQEQYNVINYLFKDNPKYKQMPIRQKCVLETIVNEVNKISEPKYNNDNNKIFAISDIEGDVYSLLRFLKHIGALKSIDITDDVNGNPQLIPMWNNDFKSKIVFVGDHTSCRQFFNKECVDILLLLQEKFGRKNIFLVKGNHEYNIDYDGAEEGGVLYNAKQRIYNKCIDKAILISGHDIYHFMHSINFALACNKMKLSNNFNHSVNDVIDFPRVQNMNDGEIAANLSKFQYFLNKIGFKFPQNHHIVFGHDIDYQKSISRRLKKFGMLPVDNENKNYFCISKNNITEYDNATGIQLDNYKISRPIFINKVMQKLQYQKYYDTLIKHNNRNMKNIAKSNLHDYARKTSRFHKTNHSYMEKLFLNFIANRQKSSGFQHNGNLKYL